MWLAKRLEIFGSSGGYPPFYGKTDQEVLGKVRKGCLTAHSGPSLLVAGGMYQFEPKYWRHISQDAKKLISQLLKFEPENRP